MKVTYLIEYSSNFVQGFIKRHTQGAVVFEKMTHETPAQQKSIQKPV